MRLAVIPGKGGSQRIPRKNCKTFFGRPIISYSIDTALRSKLFDRIVVSTDDTEIADIAKAHGVEAMWRPQDMGDVGTQEVGSHVVDKVCEREKAPRHVCVVYATAPMLTVDDLKMGLAMLTERKAMFAFSVGAEFLRDAGMFYWGEGYAFRHRIPLYGPTTVMIPIPERRVQDINTPDDWAEAKRKFADFRRLEVARV